MISRNLTEGVKTIKAKGKCSISGDKVSNPNCKNEPDGDQGCTGMIKKGPKKGSPMCVTPRIAAKKKG